MAARGASARRYAEAVFELAAESGQLDQWRRDLETLAGFTSEADVARLLASNRVPRADKLRLLRAGVESQVSPLAMNLARLLEERGKLHLLPRVTEIFSEMADERSGIAKATVTTAVAMNDDERAAVETKLSQITGKRVQVTPVVDGSILGGIVARVGDQLIDGSTRTRLVALKRRLGASART